MDTELNQWIKKKYNVEIHDIMDLLTLAFKENMPDAPIFRQDNVLLTPGSTGRLKWVINTTGGCDKYNDDDKSHPKFIESWAANDLSTAAYKYLLDQ